MNTWGRIVAGLTLSLLLLPMARGRGDGTAAEATTATAPTTTTAPADEPLPPGAVARLGDLRFFAENSRGAVFSPDGARLVAFGGTGIDVFDVATGLRVSRYRTNNGAAIGASFVGPRQVMICWTQFGRGSIFEVWDLQTGKVVRRLDLAKLLPDRPNPNQPNGPALPAPVAEFAVSADGSRVAVISDHVLLCDGQTGALIREFTPRDDEPGFQPIAHRHVQFSPDGRALVIIDGQESGKVVNPVDGKDLTPEPLPYLDSVTISADGKTVAGIGDDMDLHLFDVPTGKELDVPDSELIVAAVNANQPYQRRLEQVTFSPIGPTLAIVRSDGTSVTLMDAGNRPCGPARHPARDAGNGLFVWSPDAKTLATFAYGGRWLLSDAENGKARQPVSDFIDAPDRVAASPDGKHVLMVSARGVMYMTDLDRRKIDMRRDPMGMRDFMQGTPGMISFAPDGKSILMSIGADVRWYDAAKLTTLRRVTRQVPVGFFNGQHPVYSADGRFSATAVNGQVIFIELATRKRVTTGKPARPRNGQGYDQITPLAFSPDGKSLLVRTSAGLRSIDRETQTHGAMLLDRGGSYASGSAVYSPDGRWIATLIGDGTVSLYAAAAAAEAVSDPPAPAGPVNPYRSNAQTYVGVHLDPIWSKPRAGNYRSMPSFTPQGELMAIAGFGETRDQSVVSIFESTTGRKVAGWPLPAVGIDVTAVPNRPTWVSVDGSGTALLFDLRKAFAAAAATQPAAGADDNDVLWAAVASDDPAVAYAAGLKLLDSGELLRRAAAFVPASQPAPAPPASRPADHWGSLVAQLSSPDPAMKESAHKALEAGGNDARPAVTRALADHPGGETEERLIAIQKVIGIGDFAPPDTAPKPVPAPAARTPFAGRLIQLLGWSADPAARPVIERLKSLRR